MKERDSAVPFIRGKSRGRSRGFPSSLWRARDVTYYDYYYDDGERAGRRKRESREGRRHVVTARGTDLALARSRASSSPGAPLTRVYFQIVSVTHASRLTPADNAPTTTTRGY